jgi:hypothetical protein
MTFGKDISKQLEASTKGSLLEFRHPELVEGSAAERSSPPSWKLILRQAQDDGLLILALASHPA